MAERRLRRQAVGRGNGGTATAPDPGAEAAAAGLRYVTDAVPGIQRVRRGKGFDYVTPEGAAVRDREELRRIGSLAIPPAWQEVWICPSPRGHLQATGRDAKGRKQYRYHPRWREVRDETKFDRMLAFARALPRIRERVEQELALPGMPREKVLATLVRLLEATFARVGNAEYARENHSYGLTTLHNRHAEVEGATVHFQFRGKSGKLQAVDVRDRRLARIVKRCRELPGYRLFEYLDESGAPHAVDSGDLNAYLREITGEEFTAKDFRTWAGTVLAVRCLRECGPCDTQTAAKQSLVRAVDEVAAQLGNTRAVCRKYYIHPAVFTCYQEGSLLTRCVAPERWQPACGLSGEEAAVLALLEAQSKES
jgi:DNA topoisomerase-1